MGEEVTVSEMTGILQAVENPKRMQAQGMANGEMQCIYTAFRACWRKPYRQKAGRTVGVA